jgi:hypothetical protein
MTQQLTISSFLEALWYRLRKKKEEDKVSLILYKALFSKQKQLNKAANFTE